MEQSLTIYKASAGSGKTFTLAVEYILQLLEENAEHEFQHTLAVTFTNKATAEMKSRILETLYGLAHNLDETRGYMEVILGRLREAGKPLTEQTVSERAGKALAAILHDYTHFRVETIDAFFQSILRGMARELGLSANMQVELSYDEVIASAVDSLIETMDDDAQVRRWVLDYVNDQLDNGARWDISVPLKDFAGNIFGESYQRRSDAELDRISDAVAMKDFQQRLRRIVKDFTEKNQQLMDAVRKHLKEAEQKTDILKSDSSWDKFFREVPTCTSEGPTVTMTKALNSADPITKKKDPEIVSLGEKLRPILIELTEHYTQGRRQYCSAKLALQHLSALRLLRDIDVRAREISSSNGSFTLSSTPALLSRMVAGSDAPFIFEKIGTQLNYVMIDEFQDTSRMQWDNFKKLLFEKLASDGRGLLVGDIKQSIYRWRSGDWKILHQIEQEPQLQRFHIKPKPLDTNFRSLGEIIRFNNMFFPKAAEVLDSVQPEADIRLQDIYGDVTQKFKREDKGYVRIALYNPPKKEKGEEAEEPAVDYNDATFLDMAAQIRSLQAGGLALSNMAILIRNNKVATQIIDGFGRLAPDITLVSGEAFLLGASEALQLLVTAMRLLVDRQHKDIVSERFLMLRYQELVLGHEITLQQVAAQKPEEVLPEDFTAHREELLALPLYLLAERLYRILQLDRIKGEDVYVLTFMDELQNHLRTAGAPDVKTFLDFWDETLRNRAIPASEVPGVRILTIHKSKGLEFHTVLLPFIDWGIERDRRTDMLWCETDVAPFNELGALPISIFASKSVRASIFAKAYEAEHLERRVDALNTLYVAFTRAGANLYIWGKTAGSSKLGANSTASDLIALSLADDMKSGADNYLHYESGCPVTEVKRDEAVSENRLVINHLDGNAIDVRLVSRDPALSFRQSNQAEDYLQEVAAEAREDGEAIPIQLSQREVGKRMHEVLSRLSDAGDLETVLSEATAEGLIGEDEDWASIVRCIRRGFTDPLIASWFSPDVTVYNECSIASRHPKTGKPCILRPDRVIMAPDGTITVIDYKFGQPSRHYHYQVADYMSLMRRMYPGHEVRGYLWYIMGKGAVSCELPPLHP